MRRGAPKENFKLDFECRLQKSDENAETVRDGLGGLSDEEWRRVRAALEFSREDDRKRKAFLEMKPLSDRVQ